MLANRFGLCLGIIGIIFVAAGSTLAQNAPVRGVVKMTQADGTLVPLADAVVEPVRIDIEQGKLPPTKTNKNGEFSFVALSLTSKYVLNVSAPGAAPTISNSIRGGTDDVQITVSSGDGKRLTETEVRELVKRLTSGTQNTQSEAEIKKAQAEYEKQKAKYDEDKKKVENTTKIVTDALKAGEAAFKAEKYDEAIAKFDEGINADPDFEGSAPVLLNYKAVALKSRGFEAYKRATKAEAADKAAEMEKAKADFAASATAFDRGLQILAGAKGEDPAATASFAKVKFNILNNYIETYRLMVKTKADTTRAMEAVPVYQQYFALETDPARKIAARLVLADILREAGESEPAIVEYRAVLESSPDNADALAGVGLSLFNVGVIEDNKAKMQEGMNFMQKFADTAPDTHPLKQSVKEAVDYLKTEQKLTPQKVTPVRKRP
ncbi:MAG: hypothetical protein ACRD6X_12255 [Pyrinomonadaceae bacterium]